MQRLTAGSCKRRAITTINNLRETMQSHAHAGVFPTKRCKKGRSKPIHAAHHPIRPRSLHHTIPPTPTSKRKSMDSPTKHKLPTIHTTTSASTHMILTPPGHPPVDTTSHPPLTTHIHQPARPTSSNNCQQLTRESAHQTNKNRPVTNQPIGPPTTTPKN